VHVANSNGQVPPSPIRVHGVKVLVCQLQTGGIVGSSADDFDVTGRVSLAGPFQGAVEFCERRHLCGEPVFATQSRWQRVIVPLGQIVVFPVRVVFESLGKVGALARSMA